MLKRIYERFCKKIIQLPQYHKNTYILLYFSLCPFLPLPFQAWRHKRLPSGLLKAQELRTHSPCPQAPHTPPPPQPRLFNVPHAVSPLVSALFLSTSHSKQMVKSASGRRKKNLIRGPRAQRSSHLHPSPAEFISILTAPRGTGVTERDQMFRIHHMFS